MWRHSSSGSRSPTNRWPHPQLLLLPTHTTRGASYLYLLLLPSVPTSRPHDGRIHSWSRGSPTLIRWCMKMVWLGEPSTLTMPSQPNSRPQDSPHPYPHRNLLGQLWVTSRGVFRGLSLANLLLLLNQPPLPRVPLLRPHHQRPPRPLLRLPREGG